MNTTALRATPLLTEFYQSSIDELREHFLHQFDRTIVAQLEGEARARLADTTVPLHQPEGAAGSERRSLKLIVAFAAARRGDCHELHEMLLIAWRESMACAAVVETLLDVGSKELAAIVGQLALLHPECPERNRVEAALELIAGEPPTWPAALAQLAAEPTIEGWRELMKFVPTDDLYDRTRRAIRRLRDMGVDGNLLFRFATDEGTTVPDAVGLVEAGLVDVNTVLARAREGSLPGQSLWLGLAAQAAFTHGDWLRTAQLLRDAYAQPEAAYPPDPQALFIRSAADVELNEMLDKIGVPSIDELFRRA